MNNYAVLLVEQYFLNQFKIYLDKNFPFIIRIISNRMAIH